MSRWVAVIGVLVVVAVWVPTASALFPPTVALNPVGAAFTTSTPTLSGIASAGPEYQARVYLGLYAGTAASGQPVRLLSGPRAADGSFAIQVTPGLPDGFYTAVAGQAGVAGDGFSAPLVIEVKVHPPALRLEQPGNGVAINPRAPVFSGAAGTSVGDIPTVKLALYRGAPRTGRLLVARVLQTAGPRWSYTWPRRLATGSYTAIAEQADNAGHIVTLAHSFRVTVLPPVIGDELSLDRQGRVSIAITCPAEAGSCVGDVLALTGTPLQPVAGGPTGLIRLLFAHVAVAAGRTATATGRVAGVVASKLRRSAPLQATVRAILQPTYGDPIRAFEARSLRAG